MDEERTVDGHNIIEFIDSLGFAEETLADLVGLPAAGVRRSRRSR